MRVLQPEDALKSGTTTFESRRDRRRRAVRCRLAMGPRAAWDDLASDAMREDGDEYDEYASSSSTDGGGDDGGDARPPWVSALDIEAEQRRRKYALSEEEYAKKMASRVSKHLHEVRLEKYAQFDDELSTSSFSGDLNEEAGARAKGRAGDRRDDGDGAHDPGAPAPVSFDLDMALFWARRRADAARTAATKNATAIESEERRSKANAKEREIQELRGALAREKSRNERLTIELEKKTKETERLRSQLAKIKLSQDPPSAPTPRVDRRRGATRKVLEDQLPLYAQLRSTETARDAWFMKTTTRWY